jgi:hypothetical protein
MGRGRVPGGGAGGRHSDKWGGTRPAMTWERWKQAGTTIVVREHGRREREALGPRSARAWPSLKE